MTQADLDRLCESAQAPTPSELAKLYGHMTPARLAFMRAVSERHQQWVNEYMGVSWQDDFNPGDECEYRDRRVDPSARAGLRNRRPGLLHHRVRRLCGSIERWEGEGG